MLNTVFHPERYLGKRKKKNYFEGWYFRSGGDFPFAFIVGVSKSKADAHSFIQYLDGQHALFFRFPVEDFSFQKENMTVRIQDNVFSLQGCRVDIRQVENSVKADIVFSDMVRFRKTLFAPSVMGPFVFAPMPCRHEVISLRHGVRGRVTVNDSHYAVDTKGYIEKDFGHKFPENYIWMQAFAGDTSIISAIAWPLTFNMRGFLCLVLHNGKQYNFSLYNGTKLNVTELTPEKAAYSLRKGKNSLDIDITNNEFVKTLLSPVKGGTMTGTIQENLCASLKVKLVLNDEAVELPDSLPCAFDSCIL